MRVAVWRQNWPLLRDLPIIEAHYLGGVDVATDLQFGYASEQAAWIVGRAYQVVVKDPVMKMLRWPVESRPIAPIVPLPPCCRPLPRAPS